MEQEHLVNKRIESQAGILCGQGLHGGSRHREHYRRKIGTGNTVTGEKWAIDLRHLQMLQSS